MMQSRMRILAGVILLLSLAAVSARAENRIGYVNTARVLEEAPQAAQAIKKLEAEFGPRDKRLAELQDRIRQIEARQDGSDAEKRERERELQGLRRELKRATQEFREEYNLRRNEELAHLQKLVQQAIAELGKQERFDLIVHEGVLYVGDRIDLTERVLRKLGKK
jgi:outer membrane protein